MEGVFGVVSAENIFQLVICVSVMDVSLSVGLFFEQCSGRPAWTCRYANCPVTTDCQAGHWDCKAPSIWLLMVSQS